MFLKYEKGVKLTPPPLEITTLKKPSLIRVKKIEKSEVFTVLTEGATDISNMQQLLIFVRYYYSEKSATDTCFVNTSDLLFESENSAPDSQSMYLTVKNLIVNDLSLRLLHFQIFCSDGVMCHCWKKGRHCYEVSTRSYSKYTLLVISWPLQIKICERF